MASAYPAKVGRTVHYRTAAGKLRPAIVTAVAANLTVTAAVRTGNTVTLTVANALPVGRHITVSLADTSYNGIFTIATASGTQLTYSQTGANAGTSTGTARDIDTASLRVGRTGGTFATKLKRVGGSVGAARNDAWTG